MKKRMILGVGLAAGLLFSGQVCAHSVLASCFDNGNGTITCEGGFSDGSSAAGMEVRVEDQQGKVLQSGKTDRFGEYSFKRPSVPFRFVFDAGPGHVMTIKGDDIAK